MEIDNNFTGRAGPDPVRMGAVGEDHTFWGYHVALAELEIDIICTGADDAAKQVMSGARL